MSAQLERITADKLVPGLRYKTNTRQRNWRTCSKVMELEPCAATNYKWALLIIGNPGGAVGRGKYANCAQLLLAPSDFVYVAVEVVRVSPQPAVRVPLVFVCPYSTPGCNNGDKMCAQCDDDLPF